MGKPDAILLVGPTGSGKTPLGERLARDGLWGRRCRHFDFGRRMREIVAAGAPPAWMAAADLALLRSVLEAGALLENEHVHVAENILRAFVAGGDRDAEGLILLNGLPRHVGQAEAVEAIVRVRAVIELACTGEVVLERIRTDAGGDRAGRRDDDEASVRRKLRIFADRTAGLLGHYRRRGVAVLTLDVTRRTTPADARRALLAMPCPLDDAEPGADPC